MDNIKGILDLLYSRFLQRDVLAITSCGFIIVVFFTGDLSFDTNNLNIDNSKLLVYIPLSYFLGMVINVFRGFILHVLFSNNKNRIPLLKKYWIYIEKYFNNRINLYKAMNVNKYIIDDYERFHFIISLIGNFLITIIFIFIICINKYLFLILFLMITIFMVYIKHIELLILMESSKNNMADDNNND